MDIETRLKKVREALILDYLEFAPLILPLEFREGSAIVNNPLFSSLATDGRYIYYKADSKLLEEWTDQQIATGIVHEALHVGMRQLDKRRLEAIVGVDPSPADLMKLNLAMDYVVNYIIQPTGLPLDEMLYEAQYEGMSVEEVYRLLPNTLKNDKQQDIHIFMEEPKTDQEKAEAQEREAQIKQAFADFLTLAKIRGTLPASMLDKLAGTLKPEIPWLDLLMDWVVTVCGKEDYTWRRPSRRGLALDLYLPSGVEDSIQCLGFGSDTSGSMSVEDCSKAVQGVVSAAESVKIKRFVWVEGDAVVQRVLEFEGQFEPPKDAKGRGGTDFQPIIEELLKHDPVCIVYFTDTCGTFPSRIPPVPVLWITRNPEGTVPWGQLVRIK